MGKEILLDLRGTIFVFLLRNTAWRIFLLCPAPRLVFTQILFRSKTFLTIPTLHSRVGALHNHGLHHHACLAARYEVTIQLTSLCTVCNTKSEVPKWNWLISYFQFHFLDREKWFRSEFSGKIDFYLKNIDSTNYLEWRREILASRYFWTFFFDA